MAKKDFQENSKVSFELSEEKLDLNTSIIPDMDCQEAASKYAELQNTQDLNIADLLRLMRHLNQEDVQHQEDCPLHSPESLDACRNIFQVKMS